MYEAFYGLKADPFRLSSDANFRFDHRSYKRAKASVQYALHRAEGFVMITGRPGTGKTTLVNDLTASLPRREVVVGSLVSTQLEADDLLRMTAHAFGLNAEAPKKSQILMRLMEYLAQQHRQGLRTLLIIDEAQDLAPSALEELRLLTNLQHGGHPLLQIVLIGQEDLRVLVRRPELEQVHQRLIAAWHLEPLSPEETIGYVRHRLERAGWTGDPSIEPGVMPIVFQFSEGVPRRVNLICSRLMLYGFIGSSHVITEDDARAVAQELKDEELARPFDDRQDAWPLPEDGQLSAESTPPHASGREAQAEAPSGDPIKKTAWSEIDRGLYRAGASAAGPGAAESSSEEPSRSGSESPLAAEPAQDEASDAVVADDLPKHPAATEASAPEDAQNAARGKPPRAAPAAAEHPAGPESTDVSEPSFWRAGGVAVPLSSASAEVRISAERDWDRPGDRVRDTPPGLDDPGESSRSAVGRLVLVFVLLVAIGFTAFLLLRPLVETEIAGPTEPTPGAQIPAPQIQEPPDPAAQDEEGVPRESELRVETLPEVAESTLDTPEPAPLETSLPEIIPETETETETETDPWGPSPDALPVPEPLEIRTAEEVPAQPEFDAPADEVVPELSAISPDTFALPESVARIEPGPAPEEPAPEAEVAPEPVQAEPAAEPPAPGEMPAPQPRVAEPEPQPRSPAFEAPPAPASEAPQPVPAPDPPATAAPEPRPVPPAEDVAMAPPPEPEPAAPDPAPLPNRRSVRC